MRKRNRLRYLRFAVVSVLVVLIPIVVIGLLPSILDTFAYNEDDSHFARPVGVGYGEGCTKHCDYPDCETHINQFCNYSCDCTCTLCMAKKSTLCGHTQCMSGNCPCSGTGGCQCAAGSCQCEPDEPPPYVCPCDRCDPMLCRCEENGCTGEDCRCEGCETPAPGDCWCENCDPALCQCEKNGCEGGGECVCEGCKPVDPPPYECWCETCDPDLCQCEENGCEEGGECVCEGCKPVDPLPPGPDPGPTPTPNPPPITTPPTNIGSTNNWDRTDNRDNREKDEPKKEPVSEPEILAPVEIAASDGGSVDASTGTEGNQAARNERGDEEETPLVLPAEPEKTVVVRNTVPLISLDASADAMLGSVQPAVKSDVFTYDPAQEEVTVVAGASVPVGTSADGLPMPLIYGSFGLAAAVGIPIHSLVKRRRALKKLSEIEY